MQKCKPTLLLTGTMALRSVPFFYLSLIQFNSFSVLSVNTHFCISLMMNMNCVIANLTGMRVFKDKT